MTCWHGHLPRMSEAQLAQACEAYYRAAFTLEWQRSWGSPMNPLRDESLEAPEEREPVRRTTSLPTARPGDKTGAIDVEYVRVR